MSELVVVKYGGSVLKDAESFRAAAEYQFRRSPIAVVSAQQDFTNLFMDVYNAGAEAYLPTIRDLYHKSAKLLPQILQKQTMSVIDREMEFLRAYLDIGANDAFVGSPEGHSAILFSSYIVAQGGDAEYLTGPTAGFVLNDHGWVDMEASRQTLSELGKKVAKDKIIVVGGYLGRHHKTKAHIAGARNINDAFAAALADALNATAVEIVKDVPGVYRVPPEFGDHGLIETLSYAEASKMSWRGSQLSIHKR